ncbi:ABC transporter ATP-binding protein [Actinomadura atramentaria]|uniref:ABC transporter ATP-binding protein n=1 Tax=Actinomadura atramentaria TaxID=1990 RepID=UPI000373BD58|nr:ABC transporter ATP-binding protein [Actinomadura atramentaria]
MSAVLELTGVRAGYGRIEVLHGVDLDVPEGSLTALLGPNGAGKSTLLKTVAGLVRATSGHVHLSGVHVNGAAPGALARAGLVTVPEGRAVFPNLTVEENLRLMTYGGRREAAVRETAFGRFPRLAERRRSLAGSLSGGEQQMLALTRALVADPVVLLVDELSMGLAPMVVAELYDVLAGLADDGVTVLAVEQFAATVLAVADHAAVLVHGRIAAAGPPRRIGADLAELYLGGAA